MKLNKLLCAGLVCGAAFATAACSDSDTNSKLIWQQSSGLCEATSCNATTRADCLTVAENLNKYIEENKAGLEEAFGDYKGFDWADILYATVAALNLYKTRIAVEQCDTQGVAENANQAALAFQGLSTFEGFNDAMNAAANKCASGGCESKK